MKIRKFYQFITEELNDTPENYVETALVQLKRKIDKIFEYQEGDIDDMDMPKEKSIEKAKIDSKKKNKMSDVGFELMKEKLDGVGCGFCLAKWTQVTMHLHNGTTHSCHHPEPHKVNLNEIMNLE